MNKIYVVIPAYNAEKYIKKCIVSILNQTYKNIEVICINDGSTDNTMNILNSIAQKDKRVRVVHQSNKGSIEARRRGVSCCGDEGYICFCDADDTMPSNAIENLYNSCINNNAEIAIGAMDRIWNRMCFQARYKPKCFEIDSVKAYNTQQFIKELYCSWFGISNVPVGIVGKLYKAELIKEVYKEVPSIVSFYGDDLIVTLNAIPKAKKIVVLPNIVYHYRIDGGTTKYNPLFLEDFFALYRYKQKFINRYIMKQDVKILMDIELCNVVVSYFEMLLRSKLFTRKELQRKIEEVCNMHEVREAANNKKIQLNQWKTVDLLRENNSNLILDYICRNQIFKNIKMFIKELMYKLA